MATLPGTSLNLGPNQLQATKNQIAYRKTLPANPHPGFNPLNVISTQWDKVFGGSSTPASSASTPNTSNASGAKPAASSGGATTPVSTTPVSNWTDAQQAIYDVANSGINHSLGQLPTLLKNAEGQAQDTYNNNLQDLNTQQSNAQSKHTQNLTQNQQDYLNQENEVNQKAQQDRAGLLRTLAALGASGGSEALYLVPQLVSQSAAEGLGQAAQTDAKNAQTIATNYGNFENEYDQRKKSLANQLADNLQTAQATNDSTRQGLLGQQQQLDTQRTQAMGGNIHAALDPIQAKINDLQDAIESLKNFAPVYSGTTPTFAAASLGSYTPAENQQIIQQSQGNLPTPAANYLTLLAGLGNDKKQPLAIIPQQKKQTQVA